MARATLFNPTDNTRVAVDTGSATERSLFSKGYKLETPTQNYQTYQKPQREIFQGADNALVASDTGKQLSPSELSTAVNTGGYQDTRRSLDMQGAPDASGANVNIASASKSSSLNDILKEMLLAQKNPAKPARYSPENLSQQRETLLQARYEAGTNPLTDEQIRGLTPEAQNAIRSGQRSGIDTQLGIVNATMEGQEKERQNTIKFAGDMLDFSLKQEELTNNERMDSIKAIGLYNDMYGDKWLEVVSPAEKKRFEDLLGFDDLSQLKGIIASDPDRFQAIGATKYHGNLVFDKSTGTFVGANGEPLSEAEITAMSRVAGGIGGKTEKSTEDDKAKVLKLYNDAYGTTPPEWAVDYLVLTLKEEEKKALKTTKEGQNMSRNTDKIEVNPWLKAGINISTGYNPTRSSSSSGAPDISDLE
jgi:hypothetical protein